MTPPGAPVRARRAGGRKATPYELVFAHWAHENLALEVSLGGSNIGVTSRRTISGETVHTEGLYGVMAGTIAREGYRTHLNVGQAWDGPLEKRDSHVPTRGRSVYPAG